MVDGVDPAAYRPHDRHLPGSPISLRGVTQSAGGPPARPSPENQIAAATGPSPPPRPPRDSGSQESGGAPQRPPRESTLRSPLDQLPTPAPRAVRLSVAAWLASCLFPLAAVTYAVVRMSDVRDHQRTIALADDANYTATSLERAVDVTVWVALATLILPVIIEVVFAFLMVKRLAWARIGLMVTGVLAVAGSVIAVDALSDDQAVANRNWVLVGIGVQALLAVIGALLMYRRRANLWFATKPRPAPKVVA